MPDFLSNIAMGFGIALTWQNIGLCFDRETERSVLEVAERAVGATRAFGKDHDWHIAV